MPSLRPVTSRPLWQPLPSSSPVLPNTQWMEPHWTMNCNSLVCQKVRFAPPIHRSPKVGVAMPFFLLCSATTNLEKSFSSTGNVTACTYIVYPIVLLLCINQTVHCESAIFRALHVIMQSLCRQHGEVSACVQ